MSRRPPSLTMPTSMATAHALAILGEYTHTLDSLPLDLSRNFADLRELDAVLSSSMSVLTTKITQLTVMLENNVASKEDRLWLLAEIADEATRLKLGGEDKIRVACHAADGLRAHRMHMKTLIHEIPDADFGSIDLLCRKTIYPHVAARSYMPLGTAGEGGRRQRRGAGAGVYGNFANNGAVDASPTKKRKAGAKDDDPDPVGRTPRKERIVDASRPRNTARTKRPERAPSPAESMVSIASPLPQLANQGSGPSTSRQTANGRTNGNANKRARTANNDHVALQVDSPRHDVYEGPPSAAHPSLPVPYANGLQGTNNSRVVNGATDWTHGQLEGPGMPVARNYADGVVVEAGEGSVHGGTEGDGEADDGRTYCYCNGFNYGVMVACDGENCEREWFHLPCIGLPEAPSGSWFCDFCQAKRNARRPGRGGRKRPGGGRANARNAAA